MTTQGETVSRFLRREVLTGGAQVQRPPWTGEDRIRANCTSCGDCLRACPEAILIAGPAGTPAIDFETGACTFCGACAAACDDDVFANTNTPPWDLTASIGSRCLLSAGITCRSCTDACDEEALRYDIRAGVAGSVFVSADLCTGCGACFATCPVHAITLAQPKDAAA